MEKRRNKVTLCGRKRPDSELAQILLDTLHDEWWPGGTVTLCELQIICRVASAEHRGLTVTVSDLARQVRKPRTTVSKYVSRFLKLRMIEEMIDPDDRRRRILLPTEDGLKITTRAAEKLLAALKA